MSLEEVKANALNYGRATMASDDARLRLERAICQAHKDGETLRAIGEAADMSHQRVHQIVKHRKTILEAARSFVYHDDGTR